MVNQSGLTATFQAGVSNGTDDLLKPLDNIRCSKPVFCCTVSWRLLTGSRLASSGSPLHATSLLMSRPAEHCSSPLIQPVGQLNQRGSVPGTPERVGK